MSTERTMNVEQRMLDILSVKLAQAEANHAYASAMLEASLKRQAEQEGQIAALEQQIQQLKTQLEQITAEHDALLFNSGQHVSSQQS